MHKSVFMPQKGSEGQVSVNRNIIDNWLMIIDGDYSQAHQAKASSSHIINFFQRCSTGCLVFLEIWTDIEVEFLAHCQHIDLGCAVEDLGKADVVGLVWFDWKSCHFYEGTFVGSWRYLRWPMKVSPEAVEGIMLYFIIPIDTRPATVKLRLTEQTKNLRQSSEWWQCLNIFLYIIMTL